MLTHSSHPVPDTDQVEDSVFFLYPKPRKQLIISIVIYFIIIIIYFVYFTILSFYFVYFTILW